MDFETILTKLLVFDVIPSVLLISSETEAEICAEIFVAGLRDATGIRIMRLLN